MILIFLIINVDTYFPLHLDTEKDTDIEEKDINIDNQMVTDEYKGTHFIQIIH